MPTRVELYDGDLAQLEPIWSALGERTELENPFQTWAWVDAWLGAFGDVGSPWFLIVTEPSGSFAGILALLLRKPTPARPYRELVPVGALGAAGDHLDVVGPPEARDEVAAAIVEWLTRRRAGWDVLRLPGLSAASSLLARLRPLTGGTPPVRTPCPFVRLPGSWDEYLGTLDRKLRYNLRSRARRLEDVTASGARIERVQEESSIDPALRTVFCLHAAARSTSGDRSTFTGPRMIRFHRDVARRFLRRGWLRLSLLMAGERPIAGAYCFHLGGTTFFYQTGHDPAWRRFGPGSAIVAHSIRSAIEEGDAEFDLLRGGEPYKYQWTSDSRDDVDLHLGASGHGRAIVKTAWRLSSLRDAIDARLARSGTDA